MEVRNGYKQTEVGVIPIDWMTVELKTVVVDMLQGVNTAIDKPEYVDSGIPMLKANNIIDQEVIFDGADHISPKTYSGYSDRFKLQKNDFLFSNIGARLGTGSLLKVDAECTFAWNVMRIIPNAKKIVPEYLAFTMNSPKISQGIRNNQSGSGMGFVPKGVLKKIVFQIPPTLAEQHAIAAALSDVDALLNSLDALIAKKCLIKQGAMQELLTGKKRLSGFGGDWKTKSLSELFNISGGFTASRDQLSSDGYCYLHYGDIHMSNKTFIDVTTEFENIPKLNVPLKKISEASLLKDGDVVFVDASEDDEGTSRHVVVANPDGIPFISGLHTIVAKSKTDELVNLYRRFCFQTRAVKNQFLFYAVGTKVSGISKSNIAKIKILVPSVPEQTAIAEILSDMDAEISVLEQKREKTRLLKQGMMQELLTGRIRLI